MLATRHWIPLLALVIALGFTAVRAIAEEKDKKTGTVSGTVMGTDGKPAAGATVRLMTPTDKGKKDKSDRPTPVSTATTDSDGKFSMPDVAVGKYTVQVRLKGQGNAHESVDVKAGETASVDLKLQQRAAGGSASSGDKKDEKPADSK